VRAGNPPTVIRHGTEAIEYHEPIVAVDGREVVRPFRHRLFTAAPGLVIAVCHHWECRTEGGITISISGLDAAVRGFRLFRPCAADPDEHPPVPLPLP